MLKPGTSRTPCRECVLLIYQEKYSIHRTMLELVKTILEKLETTLYVVSRDDDLKCDEEDEVKTNEIQVSLFEFYMTNFKRRHTVTFDIANNANLALKRLEQATTVSEKATTKELDGDLRRLDRETDELADYINQIKHLAKLMRDL